MERTSVPVLEGEFLQLLGEGASGNVGLYQIDNQQYIIKTVTVNLGSNVSPKDKDLSCVIKNEIDILTKIKTFCSPFFLCLEKIRQNTDFKTNTKTVFLFFPDNPGFTPLSNISPLYNNIRDICRTCINLAKGLQTLHHHQLVHRDIKPHNILLNYESGAIKYIDFGATRGRQLFILIQKMTRVFPTQRLTIDEVCKKLDVLKAHFELNFEEEKLT